MYCSFIPIRKRLPRLAEDLIIGPAGQCVLLLQGFRHKMKLPDIQTFAADFCQGVDGVNYAIATYVQIFYQGSCGRPVALLSLSVSASRVLMARYYERSLRCPESQTALKLRDISLPQAG